MFENRRNSHPRFAVNDSIRTAGCKLGEASFRTKRRRIEVNMVRIVFSGGEAKLDSGLAAIAACSSDDSSFALGIFRVTAWGGS